MKKLYKMAFSSAALSLVLIVAEILILGFALFYLSEYSRLIYILRSLATAVISISLLVSDKNPEFKLSWLTAIAIFPVFGALLYIIFYKRRLTKREMRLKEEADGCLLAFRSLIGKRCLLNLQELGNANSPAASEAVSIMKDDTGATLFSKSRMTYFPSGEEMFRSMLRDIEAAKDFVCLEYFIIEDGQMWQRLEAVLEEKAKSGVRIHLIYDYIGTLGKLPRGFAKELSKKGINAICFGRITPHLTSAHNSRDHRKILVVDGKVAYTGGINIADEYINAKQRFGHWKDGGVRVFGDAALGFLEIFARNFALCQGNCRGLEELFAPIFNDAAESPSDGGFYLPFSDGPSPLFPNYTSKNAIVNLIGSSHNYLFITTPYLIVDYDLTEALIRAAGRGVDVRIITPGIADKRIVKIMTKSSYPKLLAGGVRIFEYEKGFIHEKTILSGASSAIIGTINLDYRSLVHHFEDGLFIYGSEELGKIKEEFLKTAADSLEIMPKNARLTIKEILVRSAVRFIAPLL